MNVILFLNYEFGILDMVYGKNMSLEVLYEQERERKDFVSIGKNVIRHLIVVYSDGDTTFHFLIRNQKTMNCE
jgi:hypothetical protein